MKGFISMLLEMFPEAYLESSGRTPGTAPPQAELLGDPDKVRQAVEATPNTTVLFPTRKAYLTYGYAIKAALGPERDQEAFGIWWDWCVRWESEPNYDLALGDWARMHAPFDVGADYVYQKAYTHSDGKFTRADVWFDDTPVSDAERATMEIDEGGISRLSESRHGKLYELLSIEDIFARPKPVWMLARHIPERGLGFLYGDPGTGKSFVSLDIALSIAFGLGDWHGDRLQVAADGVVIYLAGEGASGFPDRIAAWMDTHKIPHGQRGRFRLVYESVNMMAREDVVRLAETLQEGVLLKNQKVAMVIVDTVSRAMPGADENLQKEMTLFVAACDALRERFGCVVLGVHHAGKSGDMRGSTVLKGAGDFVLKLERKQGASVGYLVCEKQKDGPDGWQDAYRFDVVQCVGGGSSLVPTRVEAPMGEGGGGSLTPAMAALIWADMAAAWDAGAPWAAGITSKRSAAKIMVQRFRMDLDSAKAVLGLWLASGLIVDDVSNAKTKMRGLRVMRSGHVDQSDSGEIGLFD